jgi:hypothetical protein
LATLAAASPLLAALRTILLVAWACVTISVAAALLALLSLLALFTLNAIIVALSFLRGCRTRAQDHAECNSQSANPLYLSHLVFP